jgi:hypothetical protein
MKASPIAVALALLTHRILYPLPYTVIPQHAAVIDSVHIFLIFFLIRVSFSSWVAHLAVYVPYAHDPDFSLVNIALSPLAPLQPARAQYVKKTPAKNHRLSQPLALHIVLL